ncbi:MULTISPECIES: hypothetical protein [Chelativorans]|jgi:hypothetical protein|uniref:Nutrient deprivation-induced protein n=1 Tax=Chelativorans sp. (strain BNC1) TaxID=266779 RepID=Q11DL2_CHESB|nr:MULTISPECIES: hypothetical protein [Chelativorans]
MATTTNRTGSAQSAGAGSSTAASLGETAAALGSDMKEEAQNRAEEARGATSESLRTFAEAVRQAGDELAKKDEGPASQLLSQAANGLEQISNAIGQKRLEDLVGDVRRFGREHPGTFMLGSVLMGVALGRFARSAAPAGRPQTHSEPTAPQVNNLQPQPDSQYQTSGGPNVVE